MIDDAPPRPKESSIAAILPAAGSGRRFGSHENKLFALLAGEPIWFHAARTLANQPEIGRIVLAVSEHDRTAFEDRFAPWVKQLSIECVLGGKQRTDSVLAGLDCVSGDKSIEMVAIHDAARPLVRAADLSAVFQRAYQTGAALLATPVAGTLKRQINAGDDSLTVDRRELWVALTPQVFHLDLLQRAYQRYRGRPATDDAELVERMGHPVALVHGGADNIKITHPEDLLVAEAILACQKPS
ncbi:2-C-methyl-D-erythritol 4-phosphate cytidylyltransferase [Novipirellula artificiosorum]|uniref:2-C-methyl-D-erythritol 4-phosphate cytidylyltransferase n=1 Tax=Novipirellula artificiosorum TaxID=2528016 RepID=A0A5C6DQJ1_9BACT|nr:2-C-methyl-D-erythritol 4-phosphate cytidylyltransferase [Novipirellula artificiosorum]TWU37286.1 2-C-methyl-D-erythritol 4-phosphate cytidylyltransferase [Novipirellula artificiosorum]